MKFSIGLQFTDRCGTLLSSFQLLNDENHAEAIADFNDRCNVRYGRTLHAKIGRKS